MSTKLEKLAERARRDPTAQFHSLAHIIDMEVLRGAFDRIRKDAAMGVDGVTKEQYGEALERNLEDLLGRLKSKKYRHQPIRRVHIPKAPGKTRPIGVSCIEDKIVQGALRVVMEPTFEPIFRDCSYGFRPGRSAHDALRAVDHMVAREGMGWILEADIQSFFDSVDRSKLRKMIQERISDGSITRLVGKCLRAGVLDGKEFSTPDRGTAQGSVISPLFGNVYLHHVLDVWFEDEVIPRLRGRARLVRYADDCAPRRRRKEAAMAN
jgi:RNA-directed DNA polymerase